MSERSPQEETEKCPVCDREFDETIEQGESSRSPGAIECYWTVCVGEDRAYVHNDGVSR